VKLKKVKGGFNGQMGSSSNLIGKFLTYNNIGLDLRWEIWKLPLLPVNGTNP